MVQKMAASLAKTTKKACDSHSQYGTEPFVVVYGFSNESGREIVPLNGLNYIV